MLLICQAGLECNVIVCAVACGVGVEREFDQGDQGPNGTASKQRRAPHFRLAAFFTFRGNGEMASKLMAFVRRSSFWSIREKVTND